MSKENNHERKNEKVKKKPYVKPELLQEQILEQAALKCGRCVIGYIQLGRQCQVRNQNS